MLGLLWFQQGQKGTGEHRECDITCTIQHRNTAARREKRTSGSCNRQSEVKPPEMSDLWCFVFDVAAFTQSPVVLFTSFIESTLIRSFIFSFRLSVLDSDELNNVS